MSTWSATPLSAGGWNSGPVGSSPPGRADAPGTKKARLTWPLAWHELQLSPAARAVAPNSSGELNAVLPSATNALCRPPASSLRRCWTGKISAGGSITAPGGAARSSAAAAAATATSSAARARRISELVAPGDRGAPVVRALAVDVEPAPARGDLGPAHDPVGHDVGEVVGDAGRVLELGSAGVGGGVVVAVPLVGVGELPRPADQVEAGGEEAAALVLDAAEILEPSVLDQRREGEPHPRHRDLPHRAADIAGLGGGVPGRGRVLARLPRRDRRVVLEQADRHRHALASRRDDDVAEAVDVVGPAEAPLVERLERQPAGAAAVVDLETAADQPAGEERIVGAERLGAQRVLADLRRDMEDVGHVERRAGADLLAELVLLAEIGAVEPGADVPGEAEARVDLAREQRQRPALPVEIELVDPRRLGLEPARLAVEFAVGGFELEHAVDP